MDPNILLQNYIEKFQFLDCIILCDREGIEIYSAFKEQENKLRENQISTMLSATIQQTNDNLIKLNKTKLQQMMLFYDNVFVFICNWNNMILTIYASLESNISMIQQISQELKQIFHQLQDEIEKINSK